MKAKIGMRKFKIALQNVKFISSKQVTKYLFKLAEVK